MVIEPCVTIVRESERQRGPHMVATRCLCAPRVCGVLVACAGMARCMFVICVRSVRVSLCRYQYCTVVHM